MVDGNRCTLNSLFESHRIDLRRGDLFDTAPGPMPDTLNIDRIDGMMLGLAIGDCGRRGRCTAREGQAPRKMNIESGGSHDGS